MRGQSNWFRIVRRKFSRKSGHQRDIVVFNNASHSEEESVEEKANLLSAAVGYTASSRIRAVYSEEDIAAVTIQAYFRGHLARRAFRALRSLVKLQAMVRGAHVRKQARIALHCMHAMVRLQVTVRARQLLG